jgi:pyrroloquinoline-quinone synthase
MDQTLDDVTARWNLLQHNFYQRWTRGTLTHDELCEYVRQYAHVVRAVPVWLEQVRGGDTAEVARHAAEEQSHIALWNTFGEALGLSSDAIRFAPANAATAKLIRCGDEYAAKGEAAPVVWALEAQTPAVAGAKLAGLSAFYRIGPNTGGEYFAVHQHLDIEHAADLRALCSNGSQNAADAISEALWDLLTSVEAAPQPA